MLHKKIRNTLIKLIFILTIETKNEIEDRIFHWRENVIIDISPIRTCKQNIINKNLHILKKLTLLKNWKLSYIYNFLLTHIYIFNFLTIMKTQRYTVDHNKIPYFLINNYFVATIYFVFGVTLGYHILTRIPKMYLISL